MTGPASPGETPAPRPRKPRAAAAATPEGAAPARPRRTPAAPAVPPSEAPPSAASPAPGPASAPAPGAAPAMSPATPSAAVPPAPVPDAAPSPALPPRPDIAAAVDRLVAHLRGRLAPGELVAGAGALVILGLSWFLLGVVLGSFGSAPETVYLAAGATLAILWLRTSDAPPAWSTDPRLLPAVAGAGALIGGMFAIGALRFAIATGSFTLGQLVWWVGVGLLAAGAWMTVRDGRSPGPRADA